MSNDLLLDDNNELVFDQYDLVLTDRNNITKQKLKQVLTLFKGNWFLNEDEGMPYFEEILGTNASLSRIESLFVREIQTVEEVSEILKLDIFEDKVRRTIVVDLIVRDNLNNIVELVL